MESHATLVPPTSKPAKQRRRNVAIALPIAILLAVAIFLAAQVFRSSAGSIPDSIARQVSYPLYFPDPVPTGFQLQPESFVVTPEALLYRFSFEKDKELVITIQARPKNFDPSQFSPNKEVTTYVGRAYLVDLEFRTTAAIVNDESLIFLNAPDGLPMDMMERFVNSMRRTSK